ncbi:MAG: Chlorinating enzyme [Herminiimonas sp.]|nr:Chlorinating enzyme [Herminiimonas sp.]
MTLTMNSPQTSAKPWSTDIAARFQRDGYYAPAQVMSPGEAAEYRRRLEAFEASQGRRLPPQYHQKAHLLFTWLADLIRRPQILDAVESVLGPNLLVWSTSFFIKEANDPAYVSWHQDSTYWGLSAPEVVTAWVAFSDSNHENGCLRVVPGTHTMDQVEHVDTAGENNMLTRGQEIAVKVDESTAVELPLRPGEMSLHHIRLFHNSQPNQSNDRRIGFAIRYIPTRISQASGGKSTATLVRGTDQYRHFEHEPRPAFDMAPEAIAYHAEVMRRQKELLYKGAVQE